MSNYGKWLIAFDIDGTIVAENKTVSELTKTTFQKLSGLGHSIVLATGRHSTTIPRFQESLNLSMPYIASNGSVICNSDQEVVFEQKFDEEQTQYIWQLITELPALVLICLPEGYIPWIAEGVLTMKGHPYHNTTFPHTKNAVEYLADGVYRFTLRLHAQHVHTVFETLSYTLDGIAKVTLMLDLAIEISPLNVSKGTSLLKLYEYLDDLPSNIIAFGNDENDIEMLETATYGVAVENASISAKNAAGNLTLKCEDNGVAVWLRDFFQL